MSITMNLYYAGKGGGARRFAEEMEQSGTAALIRAEAGNEKYDYFFPMNDPDSDSKFLKKQIRAQILNSIVNRGSGCYAVYRSKNVIPYGGEAR